MNLPSLFRTNNQPVRTLARLQNDLDRVFTELLSWEPLMKSEMTCNCEVSEDKSHYTVKFDMPGVKKGDIKAELDGKVLTVFAERTEEKKTDGGKSRYSEVNYGSYQRSFTLPEAVEDGKVEAKFENGILSLTIPKHQISNAKQISIQ